LLDQKKNKPPPKDEANHLEALNDYIVSLAKAKAPQIQREKLTIASASRKARQSLDVSYMTRIQNGGELVKSIRSGKCTFINKPKGDKYFGSIKKSNVLLNLLVPPSKRSKK
jgi:hypothetical protein